MLEREFRTLLAHVVLTSSISNGNEEERDDMEADGCSGLWIKSLNLESINIRPPHLSFLFFLLERRQMRAPDPPNGPSISRH